MHRGRKDKLFKKNMISTWDHYVVVDMEIVMPVCLDMSELVPCSFVKDMVDREDRIRTRMMTYKDVATTSPEHENCSRDLGAVLC